MPERRFNTVTRIKFTEIASGSVAVSPVTQHVEAMGGVINSAGSQLRQDVQTFLYNVICTSGRIVDSARRSRLGGITILNAEQPKPAVTPQQLAEAAREAARQSSDGILGGTKIVTRVEKGKVTVTTEPDEDSSSTTSKGKKGK